MDRSLATLLRSLQTSPYHDDAARLLPAATSILSQLSNPLNVTLLSSQLLENDALYAPQPVPLARARQIFSVFYTAILRFREDKKSQLHEHKRSNLSEGTWIKAVVKGAGETSPRWRHTLMLGGLLLGSSARDQEPLLSGLRQKLEAALVSATNLALGHDGNPEGHTCVLFVLSHIFHLLPAMLQERFDYDALLATSIEPILFSHEGLEGGFWLAMIDQDIRQGQAQKFNWGSRSSSAVRIQEIKSRQLVSSLGALSRLLAQSIDHSTDQRLILTCLTRLGELARNMGTSWRQNKLSEIDQTEEAQYLDQETLSTTLPPLLHLLRDTMFATIILLRSILGRVLTDAALASDIHAPGIATQTLQILRDMYFVSHRFGQTSSSQYLFVNFTCLDILSQYPRRAEGFLSSIKSSEAGRIPAHPLDRLCDLFFLNTAEHLTLTVSASTNEALVAASLPYTQAQGDPRLGEIYEAAHSVVLAVFAAPQNASIVQQHAPGYVETLLRSFPQVLNPRQFRLAIKSIMKLAAPPSAIALAMPLMQRIILDMLSQRLIAASENQLPAMPDVPIESQQPLSEKSVFLLCLIDCLRALNAPLLQEWLPITANLLHKIGDQAQKSLCQQRLWETLSNGEMDVERSNTCVAWWNSRGGRDLVMFGELPEEEEDYTMSGAVQEDSKL